VSIRWANSALADLEEIHERQAIHWPSGGAAFDDRLSAIEKRLLQFPHSAPEVAQRPGAPIVAFIDLPFRLFYSVNAETIEVLAIRHTSRRSLFE
jgi:plasmid stabilization system protein ParE